MRRRLTLFLALTLLLPVIVLAFPAQATPVEDLTELSQYFPEDAPIFATIRTDEGYIEALDGLLGQVNDNLGGILPPEVSVEALLNMAVMDAIGTDYDTAVGSWLGDSIAVGLTSADFLADAALMDATGEEMNPADIPLILAFDVADPEIAVFFAEGAAGEGAVVTEEEGYTLYTGEMVVALLTEDVLLTGTDAELLIAAIESEDATLAESERFVNTVTTLPTGDYNILLYFDAAAYTESSIALLDTLQEQEGMADLGIDFSALVNMQPTNNTTIAIGFTIIEGRNLAIDTVTIADDPEAVAEQPGFLEQNPINLDFASRVPGYAQLVIHDNAFGPDTLAVFDALNVVAPIAQSLIEVALESPEFRAELEAEAEFDPAVAFALELLDDVDISVINFGGNIQNLVTVALAGITGQNLEADILSWMTGDYAMWSAFIPVESDLDFTFDMGFATEATDPDAAMAVVNRFAEVADLYDLDFVIEELADGRALNLTAPLRTPLSLLEIPGEVLFQTPELDFLIAANDDVYTLSSRPGAEFALMQAGESLADRAEFQYAVENLFLEDTVTAWYVGLPPLAEILPEALDDASDLGITPRDVTAFVFFASQLESMTLTGTVPELGTTITRLTLTIPSEVTAEMPEGLQFEGVGGSGSPSVPTLTATLPPTFTPTPTPSATPTEAEAAEPEDPEATEEASS